MWQRRIYNLIVNYKISLKYLFYIRIPLKNIQQNWRIVHDYKTKSVQQPMIESTYSERDVT